jgi:hypothetical protein
MNPPATDHHNPCSASYVSLSATVLRLRHLNSANDTYAPFSIKLQTNFSGNSTVCPQPRTPPYVKKMPATRVGWAHCRHCRGV